MNDIDLMGMRILLVDDNDANRMFGGELLQIAGAVVDEAINGQDALERVLAARDLQAYDVVLMDIEMPVLNGYEATAKIRGEAALAGLPIIALSSHDSDVARAKCLAAGMQGTVVKPFDAATLYKTLSRFKKR